MIIPSEYFLIKKPGTPVKAAGFFICCLLLLTTVWSCGTSRKAFSNPEPPAPKIVAKPPVIDGSTWSDKRADSLFMEAVKAKMLNRNDDALAKYKLFAQVRPNVPTAHYEIARLTMAIYRNPNSALEEIEKATAVDSTNKWIQNMYADMLSFAGKYEQAAVVFAKLAATERYPDEYRIKEALLYQKAGMPERALAVFESLEQSGSLEKADIYIFRQEIYQGMGNYEAAVGELRKLVAIQPEELRFLLLLSESLERTGRKAEAAEIIQQVERDHGDDPEAQYALLEHYLDKKDSAKINVFFKKAMSNKLLDKSERNNLLTLLMQYEKTEPEMKGVTEQTIKYMADQQPDDIEAIALYADFLSVTKKNDLAVVQYKRLIALDSTREEIWLQLLFNYTTPASADSLVKYGEKTIAIFPKNGMAQYLLGLGYQFKNNYSAATKALEQSLALQPNADTELKAQIYILLGDAYNNLTNHAASDSSYEKALSLQPDNASALNNYSYYLSERGERLEDAAKMSARSLEIQPGEATFLDTYGWILYRQGNYKEARKYIQQAIDKTPDPDGTLWDHLGDVELKLNNKARAIEMWRKALAKGASAIIEQKIKEHE